VKSAGADDIAILLAYARKVAIVPGYGLAVAQAQHTIRELVDLLESRGVEVFYAIHPVAGRMPGHMNVLLAEANVPYEQLLKKWTTLTPSSAQQTSPLSSARTTSSTRLPATHAGSPIYGMPILNVDEGHQRRLHEAFDAARIRRHRQRVALPPQDHPVLR
jgi:NAD(P) transhydrogenase subunit beta